MKFKFILITFFLITGNAFSQADLKEIDKYIEQARQSWDVPGFSVAIVKDGAVVFEKGYGVLEEGKKEKADENTLYAIASNTKAFIAASLATLEESKKVDLDDPVKKYLPYFELYDSYVSSDAKVRDLLCHRLGLGTYSGDVIWYKSTYSPEEVVIKSRYVPKAYSLREGYGYSNLMFIAAGEVIHATSGKTWDSYIRDTFFKPLNMSRTQTSTNALASMKNVATPHKPVDGQNKPIAWTNWDNMGAAGGIISSVHDMAQWLRLQLNHGILNGDTIFSPSIQNEMWSIHSIQSLSQSSKDYMPSRHFRSYGLGWGLYDYHGRLIVNHGGGYDGMYSRVVLVPEENLGIVVLTNTMKGISPAISNYIVDRYLGVPMRDWSAEGLKQEKDGDRFKADRLAARGKSRTLNTQPSFSLDKYAGKFYDKMYGDILITYSDAKLRLEFPSAPELNAELAHWHYDTFKIKWDNVHAWFDFGTLQFIMDNNGFIRGLNFDVPNDDIFFHELHPVKVQ